MPLLNVSSLVGALTWFGAAGYLLLRLGDWALPVASWARWRRRLGWYLVARFMGLVLLGEREMDPADYRLEGTVGQVTVGIPPAERARWCSPKQARGAARRRGQRATADSARHRGGDHPYADGFATVQPWGEFLAERDSSTLPAEKREA